MPLGTKVGLGPSHIVLDGDPAPPKKGTAPNFRSMSIVAKRSPISVTAEHLFSSFDHTVNEIDELRQQMSRRGVARRRQNLAA